MSSCAEISGMLTRNLTWGYSLSFACLWVFMVLIIRDNEVFKLQ